MWLLPVNIPLKRYNFTTSTYHTLFLEMPYSSVYSEIPVHLVYSNLNARGRLTHTSKRSCVLKVTLVHNFVFFFLITVYSLLVESYE